MWLVLTMVGKAPAARSSFPDKGDRITARTMAELLAVAGRLSGGPLAIGPLDQLIAYTPLHGIARGLRGQSNKEDENMLEHGMDNCVDLPRAEAIARLNDQLRKTGQGGRIVMTRGVMSLPGFDAAMLATALADYATFDADNDPHGERDFGDLTLLGADLLWKIDYYDRELHFGSNDPADPNVTERVLTIMLSEDW